MILQIALCGVASWLSLTTAFGASADQSTFPEPLQGTTAKVCQLTGDFDKERQEPTLSQTSSRFGMPCTDLGNAFEHKGRLYFLFGDVRLPVPLWMRDPIAYTTSEDPKTIKLEFIADEKGVFRPITIPGIGHGVFEVPGGGISVQGTMYIVFITDHRREKTMGRAVLAASEDDGYTFENIYTLSSESFLNVAMAEVAPDRADGLPASEKSVLIWGSGTYRASNPFLASIPASKIRDKSVMRYFAGLDEEGKPLWQASETQAAALFDHPQLGEFSVVWCEQLRHWLMLYNSRYPRGIVFRCARKPWGPWSDWTLVFDPMRDGYGKFMNSLLPEHAGGVSLADPGHEKVWGGEYGPYMLPRYFEGDSNRCTIYFVMSTWNPYQVVLMRADIGFPQGSSAPELEREGTSLPPVR